MVGDGTYEVEVTVPDVEWGTAAFGLIIPFDGAHGEWYQFFLWNDGIAVVDYCWDFCYDDYENLIFAEDILVNTDVGAVNTLKVETDSGLMTFYVNDDVIGSIDAELSEGNMGLIVLNDVEQELSVVFDNFIYTPAP